MQMVSLMKLSIFPSGSAFTIKYTSFSWEKGILGSNNTGSNLLIVSLWNEFSSSGPQFLLLNRSFARLVKMLIITHNVKGQK